MQLRHAARTDVGKTRDHNEDSYGVEAGGEHAAAGSLFVICDGMGGYESGEVASDLAVKTIIPRFYALVEASGPEGALKTAFHDANTAVFSQGGGKMGTTSVAALFRGDAVILANVGDCRAYLVRDGQIRQMTRDHSFVAEQVAAGMLTEQQARESSYRNIITRAIGHRPEIEVDLFREPLLQDDVLVLCSDGLHSQVEPHEIALAFTKVPLDDACRALIKLANDRGGPDNITVVAIKVVELTFTPDADYRPSLSRVTAAPAAAQAKTARLNASGQPIAESSTQQLPVYGPPPAIERRSGQDRRAAAAGSPQRRSADRAASPPVADESGRRLRSLLLSIVGLLLAGALLFAIYYLATQNSAGLPAAAPTQRPLTPVGQTTGTPAQTTLAPTGAAPRPTLVSTPTGSAAP
jgi:protein phosphatase